MLRILFVLVASASLVLAQDSTPEPSPGSGASPSPIPSPVPQEEMVTETTETVVSESPATGNTTVSKESVLTEDELPQPAKEGAPLETEDIIPVDTGMDGVLPDSTFTDPNAIIPTELPPVPPAAVSLESETERRRAETIRYRELRTKVEQEPEIAAMKEKSDTATSLEDQRAAMRTYYRMLFARITARDKSLEAKCKNMEDAYIRRLAQTRLEPTIPLNPPPTPEPIN